MVVKRTTFRPETDGFAFANTWSFDSEEKQVLEQLVWDAVTVLEAALSPIIMALLGPVIIAEAAACGPFAPLCIAETVKGINDEVVGQITGAIEAEGYGLCGGMAFAAKDYWLKQWVVPRGTGKHDQPDRSTPEGDELRSYLWARLLKSVDDNVGTFLEWMGALHLGGGPGWLLHHTKTQWANLRQAIDSTGQPVTIGLIGTTWNPLDNHQVLCYGYQDNGDQTGSLFLYDNNAPGVESVTTLDLTGSSLRAHEDTTSEKRGPLRGFFCTSYTAHAPPVAVVLHKGESASAPCVEQGKKVRVSFTAKNVGYHASPALALQIGATGGTVMGESNRKSIQEHASREVDRSFAFHGSQVATFRVGASLGTVAGIPMLKQLPPETHEQHTTTSVWVLPTLTIVPYLPEFTSDRCEIVNEAGATVRFTVDTTPLGSGPMTFRWSATPQLAHEGTNDAVFTVTLPGATGASVKVSVRVTTDEGCTTTGSLTFQTISQEQAAFEHVLCRIQHTLLYAHLFPWQIIPDPAEHIQAPDRSYIPTESDLRGLRALGVQLVETADRALADPKAWTGYAARRRPTTG
jgi:hypothetical protein